jgi:regulator of sigma E protease
MEILIKVFQLLLSLSILVIFHEFGHFIAAKIFKTRVEKFYLFFNPWFSIFKFRHKETEYGLGWLPLGGYVKISGMIDESMDKEQMKLPPQPWEFRSKPAWQRLIIMVGGVTVNVLLAFAIYIGILFAWGEEYLPTSQVNKYGIYADTLGVEMGFRTGDRIVAVEGKVIEDFQKIPIEIILEEAKTITVERDGQVTDFTIPAGTLSKLVKMRKMEGFISPGYPFIIDGFSEDSGAQKAGLQVKDSVLSINGQPIRYFNDFIVTIKANKGKEINLEVLRGLDTLAFVVPVSDKGLVGIFSSNPVKYFTFSQKNYTFFEAIPAGFSRTYDGIVNYLKQLRLLFSKEVKAYESVGGFITIGSIFPATWDWESFWRLTAFLSIMLAILNILPIPALDGGHVMFLFYEMITGRKPSDKFMEYAQIAGMILLLALLVFANGNDIVKLFK